MRHDLGDLVEDEEEVAGEEGAAVDDHVVSSAPAAYRVGGVGEFTAIPAGGQGRRSRRQP